MESIKFPGCNAAIGKDQPEYNTLYAFIDFQDAGEDSEGNPIHVPMDATFCFEFSDEEIEHIVKSKQLWVRQRMLGRNFQPILISTDPLYKPNGDSGSQQG